MWNWNDEGFRVFRLTKKNADSDNTHHNLITTIYQSKLISIL